MNNTTPTLPPISSTVGNGDFKSADSDLHRIKQEQPDSTYEHSLPSVQNAPTNNNSKMSIDQLCNDDEDVDVKIAAAVLENMKQAGANLQPIEIPSHPTQLNQVELDGSERIPTSPSGETENTFMSRIGEMDLVKKTMNVYEKGKAHSQFIKYTSEMVESYVRISKPVIGKIPKLAHFDQLACRGLDKLEEIMDNNNNTTVVYTATMNGEDVLIGGEKDESRKRRVHGETRCSSPSYRPPPRTHRTSQSNGSQNNNYAPYTYHNNNSTASTPTTTTRSRWHQMLVDAGAAAGAAGAAVSEESMKSLKYCLQWLTYATQHIENQIAVLREFIVRFTSPSNGAVVGQPSVSTLASIKNEVVGTLRKVIEVVSKYASGCLPDHAKHKVRSFILSLPTRWASINHTETSATVSPVSSPQMAPTNTRPVNQTADYARRLLSLATESLDMLISVSGIFRDTVERAESLVERLRGVGLTSGGASAMGNMQFDNIPQQPAGWSSQSSSNGSVPNGYSYNQATNNSPSHTPGSRSRRSSNSRTSNGIHAQRKFSRPTPVQLNDDEDDLIFNGHDSESESESETESMRMEMDSSRRAQNNTKTTSLNGVKKRKKTGKKNENEIMDLSY